MKSGALIWVQTMTRQFAMRHPTDGVDKVTTVEIFEPVLIWVMSIGATVELMSRRVFNTVLIMSILRQGQNTCNGEHRKTYTVLLLVVHERSNSPTGIGAVASLTTNMDSSTTDTQMVDGAGDGTRRGRHCMAVM